MCTLLKLSKIALLNVIYHCVLTIFSLLSPKLPHYYQQMFNINYCGNDDVNDDK